MQVFGKSVNIIRVLLLLAVMMATPVRADEPVCPGFRERLTITTPPEVVTRLLKEHGELTVLDDARWHCIVGRVADGAADSREALACHEVEKAQAEKIAVLEARVAQLEGERALAVQPARPMPTCRHRWAWTLAGFVGGVAAGKVLDR